MIRNYIKIAIRNLLKHKLFSFINISGLALGIASCFLIILYIGNELSFDRHHTKASRIFRLEGFYARGGQGMEPSASSNFGVAPLLKADFPEIQNYVRLNISQEVVKYDNTVQIEKRVCFADSSFFNIFTFNFVKGNSATALTAPNSLVITEAIAKKYFGNKDPLGKFIEVSGHFVKVTGVIQEGPQTSHFHADLIIPVKTIEQNYPEWVHTPSSCGTSHYTYLLLSQNCEPHQLESQFENFIRKRIGKDHNAYMKLYLRPLKKIHLYSHSPDQIEEAGDITYIYIFAIVGLAILLIASINYINLTTTRAFERMKEIGLRKVTGASKMNLVGQFLGESIIISVIALLLAFVIIFSCIPLFNTLSGKELHFDFIENFSTLLFFIGFSLITGILAGLYPAFFISSVNVTAVLKGNVTKSSRGSITLRKALVVSQFSISVVLFISTVLIYSQLQYMQNKKLGINTELLITVPLTEKISEQFSVLKNELLQNSSVVAITSANNELTSGGTNWRQYQWKNNSRNDFNIATMDVDRDFFNTLHLQFVNGRSFSKNYMTDTSDAYIINETAARLLALEEPVGEALLGSVYNGETWHIKKGRIIGVVKDFHFASLHNPIKPVVFNLQSQSTDRPGFMWLRIRGGNITASLDLIRTTWKKFEPENPFAYSFMDEDIKKLYTSEQNYLSLFFTFACLAIFIACLGIFGLTSYTALKRTKEIGIRKTLGASVSSIVRLLSNDIIWLVLIAFIIAVPIAWYIMHKWLQNYAYQTNIQITTFVLPGIFIFFIALVTISYQTLKTALSNPVKSLRTE